MRISDWSSDVCSSDLPGPGRWADGQPIQPKRIAACDPVFSIERQKLIQGELLPALENVALILGDDKRQPGDLGREVASLDDPTVGQRNIRLALFLAAPSSGRAWWRERVGQSVK